MDIKIINTDDTVSLEDESLLEALRKNGIRIRSSCGGHATCSDCIVKVMSGDKNLSPVNFEEKKLLGNVYYITKERLSCQVRAVSNSAKESESTLIEIVNLEK